MLRRPLQAKSKERVLTLMSYTRTFVMRNPRPSEFTDWLFVLTATGSPHLFPNLKTLIIYWNTCQGPDPRNTFSLLASPSIEHVVHRSLRSDDETTLLVLHSTLRKQNAPLTSIEIRDGHHLAPGIIPHLLPTEAHNVFFNLDFPTLPERDCFAPWYLALSSSPNLTNLRIQGYPQTGQSRWKCPSRMEGEKFCFENLRRLELHGTGHHNFLLGQLDCPSLVSLSLHLVSSEWRNVLLHTTHFTSIENFSITLETKRSYLQMEDLRPILRSLSALRHLQLLGISSQLTEADVIEILTARSSLRALIICGPASDLLLPSILSSIAQPKFCQLETICLPINFSRITPLNFPAVGLVQTSLKRLTLPDGTILPDLMREKLKLAEFVCHTFPNARVCALAGGGYTDSKAVNDLEELRYYVSRNSNVDTHRQNS